MSSPTDPGFGRQRPSLGPIENLWSSPLVNMNFLVEKTSPRDKITVMTFFLP